MKKHNILKDSTTLEARTELSAVYEKINDKGSAKMKKNEHIITEDIKPNLTP